MEHMFALDLSVRCGAAVTSQQLINAQKELERRRRMEGIVPYKPVAEPVRAGWLSAIELNKVSEKPKPKQTQQKEIAPAADTIPAHPGILTAMLKNGCEAAGRVYLLLRYIDHQGRGWLPIQEVRERLTKKQSPLKICSWRRLRQILNQGEGVFWYRNDKKRLWIRGVHKIAYALSVEHLQGLPIDFPVAALLGQVSMVRAHFYASFHSGRKDDKPISRETLEELTGVPERTQRDYDKLAAVKRERNIATGGKYTKVNVEQAAWEKGRGVFKFHDVQGKQGRKGTEYIAWHLPNSYSGPHARRSRRSQKCVNRKLADLLTKGTAGNGEEAIDKIFWHNAKEAGRAYNRNPRCDAYWPYKHTWARKCKLWYVLSGERR